MIIVKVRDPDQIDSGPGFLFYGVALGVHQAVCSVLSDWGTGFEIIVLNVLAESKF